MSAIRSKIAAILGAARRMPLSADEIHERGNAEGWTWSVYAIGAALRAMERDGLVSVRGVRYLLTSLGRKIPLTYSLRQPTLEELSKGASFQRLSPTQRQRLGNRTRAIDNLDQKLSTLRKLSEARNDAVGNVLRSIAADLERHA